MIRFVLRSRGLAKQAIAANRPHVGAVRPENAGVSKKTHIFAIGCEDIPAVDEREVLTF